MSSLLPIGKFSYIYPVFLILHFVFASFSCSIGSLSYFWKRKIPHFWHHFFYFFVFSTGLVSFALSWRAFSSEKFFLAINTILLFYLPVQKRGIVTHAKLGFLIWGLSLISLILGMELPYALNEIK